MAGNIFIKMKVNDNNYTKNSLLTIIRKPKAYQLFYITIFQ